MVAHKTVRLFIRGMVQQVGFRNWTQRQALTRGIEGWVRNRADGAVECLLAGDPDAVDAMVEQCSRGPTKAQVTRVDIEPAQASDLNLRGGGVLFDVLPTV